MASSKNGNIYFEVILPSETDGLYNWTLYKGKTRIVIEGVAGSVAAAREAIVEAKKEKGIVV